MPSCRMWGRRPLAERSGRGFGERRRVRRRRFLFALAVLAVLLLSGTIYGLWQSAVRVSHVEIFGGDPALADYARSAMRGAYGGIIPRDSIFFFPEGRIRADILAAHSDIAALSIFRSGFTGLSIKIDVRAPVARWCGLSPIDFSSNSAAGHGSDEYCYIFDASGFIYAAADSAETINSFILYAPLAPLETPAKARPGVSDSLSLTGLAGDTLEPLDATIADAEKLPAAFDFARELATLGSPVTRVVIHDGEVDNYLRSGTRVTYVLGNEQNAFTALVSAKDNLNLADGSLDYVDLRFEGKVYLRRK